MQAYFAAAHTAMAKKTSGEREAFVAAMIDEVNSLLGEFSRDRNDMARKGRHDREVFLSEMRRQVTGLRKETADDLDGGPACLARRESRKVPARSDEKGTGGRKTHIAPGGSSTGEDGGSPEFKAESPDTFRGRKETVVGA